MQTLSSTPQVIQVKPREQREVIITEPGAYVVELLGAGGHVNIIGRFMAKVNEDLNIELTIRHKSGHTSAQTSLKGVVKDFAKVRFFGRIQIDPGCPGVQSFLEERLLLLSPKAHAEAVPELEILSDDVKCSHAASISQVPQEHMFYLQSRGLSVKQAEELVVESFLSYVPDTSKQADEKN